MWKWSKHLAYVVVAACLHVPSPSAAACTATIGIPGNAPFSVLAGTRVKGIIAEVAEDALRSIGCTAKPLKLPFPRMYKWVHDGRIAMATSVLKTPDRSSLAHYSRPIVTEYTVVMVPRGRGFALERAGDLRGRKIGGRLGFKYPPLNGTGVKLLRERSYEINIRKVAAGRIDGTLIGSITGPYIVKSLGLADQVEFLPKALGRVPLGVALSRKAFSETDLARVNEKIGRILQSNHWKEMLVANGVEDLVRPWQVID